METQKIEAFERLYIQIINFILCQIILERRTCQYEMKYNFHKL